MRLRWSKLWRQQKPLERNASPCSSLGYASLRRYFGILREAVQMPFAVLLVMAGCATSPVGLDEIRFIDQPIIWRVDDQQDVPQAPAERIFLRNLYFFEQSFVRPTARALDRVVVGAAANVNAVDEVPDSSWFTNRIGMRSISAEDIRRGPRDPARQPGPAPGPWLVKSTKVGGVSPGFIIKDQAGDRYILKFDHPGVPELETASDVVCQRLLWAIGYHVPEDEIVYFRPERLVLAANAQERGVTGEKKPLTQARLREILRPLTKNEQGMLRGLSSRFLPGKPLGGFPQLGVRSDDPNDTIPHERRREVRGAWLFFAWLDHTDVKEDNMLDVYTEQDGRRFVRHYFLDFGKALGGMGYIDRVPMDGYRYYFDIPNALKSWVSLGIPTQVWEKQTVPTLLGVGRIEAELFEPDRWKPFYPYIPFDVRDPRDDLWAARILRQIRPEHIAAALEVGGYTSAEAKQYLLQTLQARQVKLLRWVYARTNALSGFQKHNNQLCFDDLWHRDGLSSGPTRYGLEWFDGEQAQRLSYRQIASEETICLPVPQASYSVLRVHNLRLKAGKWVDIHVVRDDKKGAFRVIGIRALDGTNSRSLNEIQASASTRG